MENSDSAHADSPSSGSRGAVVDDDLIEIRFRFEPAAVRRDSEITAEQVQQAFARVDAVTMTGDLLERVEVLLDTAPAGLTPAELDEAVGGPEGSVHEALWRAGRSLGWLFDGVRWRRGSTGANLPPLVER